MKDVEARAARIGLVLAAWKAAHNYADHIGQDSSDALDKGDPGWPGRMACARHVTDMTLTKLAALAVAGAATGIRLSPRRVAVAMAIDAASHYVIDRRTPLRRLAKILGKTEFYELGDACAAPCRTGAYAMDQAMRDLVLFLAALYAGG
ncbi:MAG: hypothetical protein ACRDS0_03820 [Pseudonocardiaceae bacterium]